MPKKKKKFDNKRHLRTIFDITLNADGCTHGDWSDDWGWKELRTRGRIRYIPFMRCLKCRKKLFFLDIDFETDFGEDGEYNE